MYTPRYGKDRGTADLGWLKTRYSFSFADYYDPEQMGWRVLRVINDDTIAPATGFGTHGHRDMEIITYMCSGLLRHGDSMENSQLLRPSEVQRMSAGSGVRHSEVNGSSSEETVLLQIWITPDQRGIKPEYEQRVFPAEAKQGNWLPLASPDGRGGSMVIHQDAILYATLLQAGQSLAYTLQPGRYAYLHVVEGEVSIAANGLRLKAGDAVKIAAEDIISIRAETDVEALLFDLP